VKEFVVTKKDTSYNKISFEEAIAKLEKEKIMYLDTETTGLDLDDKVIMAQVCAGNNTIGFDYRDLNIHQKKKLTDTLNGAYLIVGANLAFDYNKFKTNDQVLVAQTYDILLAEEIFFLGKESKEEIKEFKDKAGAGRYSLAGLVFKYLGKRMNKDVRKNFSNIGNTAFSDKEWKYGLLDASIMKPLFKKLVKVGRERGYVKRIKVGSRIYDDVMFASEHSLCLADMEYNGVGFDRDQWLSNRPALIEQAKAAEQALANAAIESGYPATQSIFGSTIDINWKSSKQILHVFNTIGSPLKDKHGKPSTKREVLEKCKHPLAAYLLQYRGAVKRITTYGQSFVDRFLFKDNRIRTKYRRVLRTMRISSSSPNIQQIPSTAGFRKAFIGLDGRYIKTADYSQQEKRVDAEKTKDPATIEFFNGGHGDMHSFTASKMLSIIRGETVEIPPKLEGDPEAMKKFNAHPDKAFRTKGKVLGFLMDYGGSPSGLATKLNISLSEAKQLFRIYFEAFPAKHEYFKRTQQFAIRNKFVYIHTFSDRTTGNKHSDSRNCSTYDTSCFYPRTREAYCAVRYKN